MRKYDALIFAAAAVLVLGAFVFVVQRTTVGEGDASPSVSIWMPTASPDRTPEPSGTGSPEGSAEPPLSDTPVPGVTGSGERYVQLGRCRVFEGDKARIEIPAQTRIKQGPLEFLICSPRGKVHETLLVIDDEPRRLMGALLAMGLNQTTERFKSRGELRPIGGDGVRIYVRWDGLAETPGVKDWAGADPVYGVRIESLLYDSQRRDAMPPAVWLFTGSFTTYHRGLEKDIFVADFEGAFAAIYHDPVAVLDNPHPEGADDDNYVPYSDRLPDPNTPVTLTLVRDSWTVPEDYPAERPDNSILQTPGGNFHPFDAALFNERTEKVLGERSGFSNEDLNGFGPHYFVTQAECIWWASRESAEIDALTRPAKEGIELVLPEDHLLVTRGFRNGDVIMEIDSEPATGSLKQLLLDAAKRRDGRIYLAIKRGERTLPFSVILLGPEWKPSRGTQK